jgi:hypothetical protein
MTKKDSISMGMFFRPYDELNDAEKKMVDKFMAGKNMFK